MLSFTDNNKSFEVDGDLLKTMPNYEFNVGQSNLQEPKISRQFAEEMNFDIKNTGRPSTRGKSLIKLPTSPAIMAPRISTKF